MALISAILTTSFFGFGVAKCVSFLLLDTQNIRGPWVCYRDIPKTEVPGKIAWIVQGFYPEWQ